MLPQFVCRNRPGSTPYTQPRAECATVTNPAAWYGVTKHVVQSSGRFWSRTPYGTSFTFALARMDHLVLVVVIRTLMRTHSTLLGGPECRDSRTMVLGIATQRHGHELPDVYVWQQATVAKTKHEQDASSRTLPAPVFRDTQHHLKPAPSGLAQGPAAPAQ